MRILIIKTAQLEEIILVLPVLDYLHRVFVGVETDWLVDGEFRDLLADHPLVGLLLTSRYAEWRKRLFSSKSWREAVALKRSLEERRYDMVFDLEGTLLSGLASRFTGCRRRYGFDADLVAEPANLRFECNRVPMRKQDHHLTDRALRMVSVPFGRDYAGQHYSAEIPLHPEEEAAAALFMATLSDGLVFLFYLGAGCETRLWHEAGWIELGKELLESFSDATILLSGSGGVGEGERIAHGIGRQTRLLPTQALRGSTAILKKMDLVVGGDCVPVHLASAMMTPTVSFYRSTEGKIRAPRGEMHRFIQSPMKCSRCLKQTCDKDITCRESIKSTDLAAAARALLLPPA